MAPTTMLGLVFLLALTTACVVGPALIPHQPNEINLFNAYSNPSQSHWLGTDELGRDVLVRLLHGGRQSLLLGLLAAGSASCVGTIVGAVAGFFGGTVDVILMRFVDGLLAIPTIFLILLLVALLGSQYYQIVIALGFILWMDVARLVRGEVLRTKNLLFVESARALGARSSRLIVAHLVPQALPAIIVATTLATASAILIESAISFLGLGVQPPNPTWGNLLSNSQNYMWQSMWLAIYPGVLILLTILSLNTLGDELRDLLDPHTWKPKRGRDQIEQS